MKKVIVAIVFAVGLLAVGWGACRYMERLGLLDADSAAKEPIEIVEEPLVVEETTITSSMVEEALEPASDLVTLAYRYTNASTVSDVKKFFDFEIPLTESRAVFTYSGIVRVGYDLSQIAIDVDNDAKTITLTLPEQKIVSNEIDFDSFDYVIEESSVFNPQKMSESTAAIDDLKADAKKLVEGDKEFAAEARKNAEVVLASFLRAAGIADDYAIEFV